MASFNTLPSDIIRIIYLYAVSNNDCWSSDRVYAWICRHWRATVFPILYSEVYFEQQNHYGPGFIGDTRNVEMVNWRTNFHLIESVNAVEHVRDISFTFTDSDGLLGFHETADADFEANDWTRVTSLNLANQHEPGVWSFSVNRKAITEFADYLTRAMPNIVNLIYENYDTEKYTDFLFRCLTKNLAPNLNELSSDYMPIRPGLCLNNLSWLKLGMHNISSDLMAVINPGTLQVLDLYGLQTNDIWRMFIPTNSSVMFTSLTTLILYFGNAANSDSLIANDANACFPNLRELEIINYPDSYRIFNNCAFSADLTHIKAFYSPHALLQLYNNLSCLRINSMKLIINDRHPSSYLNVLNQYFGNSKAFSNARLVIPWPINAKFVRWSSLTYLAINAGVHISRVFKLITALPSLVGFSALEIYKFHVPTDAPFDFSKHLRTDSLPTNSNLSYIAFADMQEIPRDIYLDFILALLGRFTRLCQFKTDDRYLAELCNVTLDSISEHPQLKGLTFTAIDNSFEF